METLECSNYKSPKFIDNYATWFIRERERVLDSLTARASIKFEKFNYKATFPVICLLDECIKCCKQGQ